MRLGFVESDVEEACLEWFAGFSFTVLQGPDIAASSLREWEGGEASRVSRCRNAFGTLRGGEWGEMLSGQEVLGGPSDA